MPATAQANLGLRQGWTDLEDGWGEDMNANLRALDLASMPRVLSRTLATPPGSPSAGDAYIVATSPTGAWASRALNLARWSGSAWEFMLPKRGWEVWDDGAQERVRYTGSAWAVPGLPSHTHTIADVTGLQAALDGKAAAVVTINNQAGTAYTLALADAGACVRMTGASASTVTVPTAAAVAFPVGASIAIRQAGAGAVSISGASGVTINAPTGYSTTIGRQGGTATALKVGAAEWDLTGDLAAA